MSFHAETVQTPVILYEIRNKYADRKNFALSLTKLSTRKMSEKLNDIKVVHMVFNKMWKTFSRILTVYEISIKPKILREFFYYRVYLMLEGRVHFHLAGNDVDRRKNGRMIASDYLSDAFECESRDVIYNVYRDMARLSDLL